MSALFALVLAASPDAFFAARVLDARAAPSASEAAFSAAPSKAFKVSAQRTVRLNDKEANALLEVPGAGEVTVRAVATAKELVVRVEWPDLTEDRVRDEDVNLYADAVAVETPQDFGAGKRLPYVGMGDEKASVRLWQQKATQSGAQASAFLAGGFGSLTRLGPAPAAMAYDAAAKRWRATFVLPRSAHWLVPVAFAVWDGARKERAGYKQLSGWSFVRLPGVKADEKYVAELAWGYGEGALGNPAVGQALASAVCATCHQLPGVRRAPAGLAPDLSDVGAIATPAYLRDSILSPTGVVVHHLPLDRRYDKEGARDPNGAYPAATAFAWAVHADGGTTSRMPSFSGFSDAQVKDLVAFLLTLQGETK